MSPQIVLDYLSYLENAFLVFKVNRSDLSGKKIFETNEKYYFEDIGLKNALTGENNIQINQVVENAVFNHLKIAGYDVKVGVSGKKEIDFIAYKNGKKLYVQATYLLPDQQVIDREFGNLLEVNNNYKKMVVSLDQYAPKNVQGVEHIHLIDFLSNTKI
jgi:predicted AAA+ superfamily ATPase